MWPFKRKQETETREAGQGYTAAIMAAREVYISGSSGLAELSGTVQSCISMWEHGLSMAEVSGTDMITPSSLSIMARGLALRGEAVFLINDVGALVPVSDWELSTRAGIPRAYRLSIPDASGGTTHTALAAEVLHVRIGSDCTAPWAGSSPLARSSLSAGMLQAVESALSEFYEYAPLGTSIVPFPESPDTDLDVLSQGFRGKRGRTLLRESVQVHAAGGPAPQGDWKAQTVSPDISGAMTKESLEAARASIQSVYGCLPSLFSASCTGPQTRESQRHLAQWQLQPIANLIGAEATAKLGQPVTLDVMQAMQAFDAGGRARAAAQVVELLARAKEAGVDPDQALKLVNWDKAVE